MCAGDGLAFIALKCQSVNIRHFRKCCVASVGFCCLYVGSSTMCLVRCFMRFLCVFGLVALPFCLNPDSVKVVASCNQMLPEDPGPLCGPVLPNCENIFSENCPTESDCFDVTGLQRYEVPKDCEGGGVVGDNCKWAELPMDCYWEWACQSGHVTCIPGMLCWWAPDSYRENYCPPGS